MAKIEIAKKEELDSLSGEVGALQVEVEQKSDADHSHDYSEITNTPSIPSVPTDNSELSNGRGYIDGSYDNTASGLTATNIQDAIDELKALIDGLNG